MISTTSAVWPCPSRTLSAIASGAPSRCANLRARLADPAWGETTTGSRTGTDVRTERNSRLVLLVALGVTEVRNDHRDRVRARTRECIDPEQQLHEVRVGRKDGRLDQVDASATHVLQYSDE